MKNFRRINEIIILMLKAFTKVWRQRGSNSALYLTSNKCHTFWGNSDFLKKLFYMVVVHYVASQHMKESSCPVKISTIK